MFTHLRYLLPLLSLLALEGTTPPSPDPPKPDPPTPDPPTPPATEKTFTQDDVNRLVADERRKTEQRLKDDAAEAKRKEDEARQRELDEKRGDFDKVKADLETKIADTERERDDYKRQLDEALEQVGASVRAAWDALPEEVRDMYDGDAEDVLKRQGFLSKPSTQKLLVKLGKVKAPGHQPDTPPRGPAAGPDDMPPVLPASRMM